MSEERVTDDLVERMHACLADALERTRTEPFASPVTVAEIYQDLVPYRHVRTELGFDMNADYEHTLLRLLAGEGDLARLDPSEARDALRQELDSPNPNVGLFRKFAACDVWVSTPERAPPAAPSQRQAPAPEVDRDDMWDPRVVQWLEEPPPPPVAGFVPAGSAPAMPEGPPPEAGWTDEGAESELLLEDALEVLDEIPAQPVTAAASAASTVADGGDGMAAAMQPERESEREATRSGAAACAFCGSQLPSRRAVRFCAMCGADQSTVPCVACGEAIEEGWRFCVACGSAAPDMAPA